MLDGVVGIKQEGADRADFGALDVLGHPAEAVGVDYLNVVIQKEQPRSFRLFDSQVVDRGIIEWPSIVQQSVSGSAKINARLVRLTVVIDNDDLVIWIACPSRDALDTAGEQVDAIACWNNDRYFPRPG